MTDRVAPISAVSYPTDSFRQLVQAFEGGQQGVVNAGDLMVSQHAGTPAMNVDVAPGYVALNGVRNTVTQGMYGFLKDAVATYTIAASDPTNPRNDLVCAVVTDSVYAVDGTPNTQNVRVLTGTPSSSPVDPAIPATWSAYVILARVRVNAGVTSILNASITDLRTRAVPQLGAGGTLGYASVTFNAGPSAPPYDIPGATVSVIVGANRRLKISGQVSALQSNVTSDQVALAIFEGGTQLITTNANLTGGGSSAGIYVAAVVTPSAGLHTYKLTAQRSAGSGSLTNNAAAGYPTWILVEDIGPV